MEGRLYHVVHSVHVCLAQYRVRGEFEQAEPEEWLSLLPLHRYDYQTKK